MVQIIEEPTRNKNTLDLLITNIPSKILRTDRLPIYIIPGISEHDVVYAEIDIKPVRHKQTPRKIPLYIINWYIINWYDSTSPPDVDHPSTRFLEAVRDSFMSQHVTEPTHYRGNCTPNTLDLILTNEEGMVENIKYMAPVGKGPATRNDFVNDIVNDARADAIFATLKTIVDDETSTISSTISLRVAGP